MAQSLSREVANRVKAMREVSEAEAYFRLDPELSLSSTNLNVEWVNTAFPDIRTGNYVLDDGPNSITLPGKPGIYSRASGLLDKYEARYVVEVVTNSIFMLTLQEQDCST